MQTTASSSSAVVAMAPLGTARNVLELTGIFEPDVQIVRWQRDPLPAIDAYLASAITHGCTGVAFRCVLPVGDALDAARMPDLPGRPALLQDVTWLTEIYAELMGCQRVGVRFEVQDRAMCPRFHVDQTGIRLLCTYRGSGTEWLDDRHVNRSKLGHAAQGVPDEASGLFGVDTRVERAQVGDVLLMKGCGWQGNEARGIIHRSPPVPAGAPPRVLLALDAIWH